MTILRAVDRAYQVMAERGWDKIYWAIDLHGVCLKSNYETGNYQWINQEALEGLREISRRPESRIILWSSVYPYEQVNIVAFFLAQGIRVDGFNQNPFEGNTEVSSFGQKFYFSILLDDKAGFDPDWDWKLIKWYLRGMER